MLLVALSLLVACDGTGSDAAYDAAVESLATRVEAVPAIRDLRVRVTARIEQVARDPEGAAAGRRTPRSEVASSFGQ